MHYLPLKETSSLKGWSPIDVVSVRDIPKNTSKRLESRWFSVSCQAGHASLRLGDSTESKKQQVEVLERKVIFSGYYYTSRSIYNITIDKTGEILCPNSQTVRI